MRRALFGLAALAFAVPAFAGHNGDSTIFTKPHPGFTTDGGWVVSIPAGTSDFFNQGWNVIPGLGNVEGPSVSDGLPISGIGVSVADFGSGTTYPVVGVFRANLGLDPSGNTPDLSSPVAAINSPSFTPGPLFDFIPFDLPEGSIAGQTRIHTVVQFPPGDPGLLGVGADSSASATGNAGFTQDGYSTPSNILTFVDWGLNPGQDNSATASCKVADRKPHGRLRVGSQDIGSGDGLTRVIDAGEGLNLAFFGTKSGDKLRLYFNTAPCNPAIAIGPVLPTIADGDGDGTYIRLNATWPAGFPGQTFRFSAVWGNPGCSAPGVGFTNCVTIVTKPAIPFTGILDDGTVESGWVVSFPTGSADYFSNDFGNGQGANGLVGLTLSVLDFGTTATGFPTAGVSNANLGVDPTGFTPDLNAPLALLSPFTFPPGTFATTSGQYISHAISVPGGSLGTHVHGWVQFPPGDPGLLGIGGDTTTPQGRSTWTLDGYSTPANVVGYANWGIRVNVN